MMDPVDVLRIAAFGSAGGLLAIATLLVYVHTESFLRRVQWVDDATRIDRVRATARVLPTYIHRHTDWRSVSQAAGWSIVLGFAVGVVVALLGAGFVEVFLS